MATQWAPGPLQSKRKIPFLDDHNLLHYWTGNLWISCYCWLGAPTWMVATNNVPDEIKCFVQLVWDVFMIKLLWEHRKGVCAKLKILIHCRVHAQASVVPPTFLAISLLNCATFPLHSLPVHVCTWKLLVNHMHIYQMKSNATCTSSKIFL